MVILRGGRLRLKIGLFNLANNRSEATFKPPVTAMHPDFAINSQSSKVKVFSKQIFVHQLVKIPYLLG